LTTNEDEAPRFSLSAVDFSDFNEPFEDDYDEVKEPANSSSQELIPLKINDETTISDSKTNASFENPDESLGKIRSYL
jgi:hypothetical protein